MKYKVIENMGILKGYSNLISINEYNGGSMVLYLSVNNLSILKEHDLNDFMYAVHFYDKKIVLSDLKERHVELLPNELIINEIKGECYPIYKYDNYSIEYNPSRKKYVITQFGDELFSINKNQKSETKIFGLTLLEYTLHLKENSSIKAINLTNGNEKWKKEFPWQIGRCEHFNNLLLVDYRAYEKIRKDKGYEGQIDWYHPEYYIIALDAETGEEIWKMKAKLSFIDRNAGSILKGGNEVREIDINTGEIKNQVKIVPENHPGYSVMKTDEAGYYYINSYGSFGKINKQTGIIEWEFDLRDEKGGKRELGNWLVLGNGKLVLQALPNHPNGDLMCIFDPNENMEVANIVKGEIIKNE